MADRTLVGDIDRVGGWLDRELVKTRDEIADGLDRFLDRCTEFSESGFGAGFFTGLGVAAAIVWWIVVAKM
jgi:hypothetical protein